MGHDFYEIFYIKSGGCVLIDVLVLENMTYCLFVIGTILLEKILKDRSLCHFSLC